MVEPQEDYILKMADHIAASHILMDSLNSTDKPYMADRAKQNAERLVHFQIEINLECKEI